MNAQNEFESISKTLTDYIEGSTQGQPNRLKSAFYENLNLYYVKNDSIKVWSGKKYILSTRKVNLLENMGKLFPLILKTTQPLLR